MGIVNVNDDSFCRDGTLEPEEALRQAAGLIRAGADIIDVGAESARTNRLAISPGAEIDRLRPFLRDFSKLAEACRPADDEQVWPPLLSLNTWRAEVLAEALAISGDIVNDIGALPTPENAELCARHETALVIMHSVGQPKEPHTGERYADLWATLRQFFDERIARARKAGISEERIILDPGIDFAKQCEHNLAIYAGLNQLVNSYPVPWLIPISRKTVIGQVLGQNDPRERDAGTVACLVASVLRGASILRVHNVRAMYCALKVVWAIESSR